MKYTGREGLITQIRACCDLGYASYCYFDCEWPYIITGYIICIRYIHFLELSLIVHTMNYSQMITYLIRIFFFLALHFLNLFVPNASFLFPQEALGALNNERMHWEQMDQCEKQE